MEINKRSIILGFISLFFGNRTETPLGEILVDEPVAGTFHKGVFTPLRKATYYPLGAYRTALET